METFIPYAQQSINDDDINAVSEALKQNLITRASKVESFEKTIAEYCGAQYAVAFNSGTTALMAAYSVSGMGPSDRLITTPNTFIATVGAAVALGATPVFVDIDLETGNIDLEQLLVNTEYKATRTRLFLAPVHFSGVAIDGFGLHSRIKNPNVMIIEDGAHALGSQYPTGEKIGSCTYCDMTIFSFHPAKTITTGEGGMVTTNDPELYHKLKLYRNNGIEREAAYISQPESAWYYEVQKITGGYNFTEMQAALGLSQFGRIESFISHRRKLVKYYREKLAGMKHITLLSDKADDFTAFHLFVVLVDFEACGKTRTEVMEELRRQGVGTQLHYIPLYRHPVFRDKIGDISEYFPNMESYYKRALSLPLYYDLTLDGVDKVVSALRVLSVR